MNPSNAEDGAGAETQGASESRRKFLFKVALLIRRRRGSSIGCADSGLYSGPSLKKDSSYNSWVSLGAVNDFPEGETRLVDYRNPVTAPWDGQTGNVACWVRRISGEQFQIFAINCAHLGCPVRWFAQSKLFLCPCHGGAYYADGSRASGPPPRGLFEYQHKISGGPIDDQRGRNADPRHGGLRQATHSSKLRPQRSVNAHDLEAEAARHRRLQLAGAPTRAGQAHRRSRGASHTRQQRELVVCFRQRRHRCCWACKSSPAFCSRWSTFPRPAEAWNSLQFLDHNITLGWFLRAVHGWGSNFMIAIVLIHMAQVFLFGAYKFPRELTWIVGVFLLLLTLGMAFTGQVLRFDQDAYWGLGIGASIMSRVPAFGASLVHALLGGPIIGGATLSRFFALHVFVIPGILLEASACMCGWCCVSASMSGPCRADWSANPLMSANIRS